MLPKLAPHGLIVVDNTLRTGTVLDGGRAADDSTRAIVPSSTTGWCATSASACVLLTVRDGVTLIRRR